MKKRVTKKLLGPKFRRCACGAMFRYKGKGRPFKKCPKCR